MPDPIVPEGGEPPVKPIDPKGTPPVKPGEGSQDPVDFSKLSDDQLAKVLEDPRLFNLPRIKELRDAAKEAKKLKDAATVAENERLTKQGEFETLANNNKLEADKWKSEYEKTKIDNQIFAEASKQGVTRLDLVEKLIDRSKVVLDAEGTVTGVADAVTELLKNNEFLKGDVKNSLGGGTNPTGAGGGQFTLSQIQDPVFYQKHHAEIMRAQATGNIIDDLS